MYNLINISTRTLSKLADSSILVHCVYISEDCTATLSFSSYCDHYMTHKICYVLLRTQVIVFVHNQTTIHSLRNHHPFVNNRLLRSAPEEYINKHLAVNRCLFIYSSMVLAPCILGSLVYSQRRPSCTARVVFSGFGIA